MSTQDGSDKAISDTNTPAPLAVELANLRESFSTNTLNADMQRPRGVTLDDTLVDRRSPLPLDNAYVQKTKDQIRSIVETIAGLANSPIEPQYFIDSALPKIVEAMGARGAALWQQHSDQWRVLGKFRLPTELLRGSVAAKVGLESSGSSEHSAFEQLDYMEAQVAAHIEGREDDSADSDRHNININARTDELSPSIAHRNILDAVAREKQPILIPPGSVSLTRDRPTNPIEDLLILAPLVLPNEHGQYWLQVVQSPSGGPSSQRGYLRFVAQMADLLSDFYRSYRLRMLERDRNYLSVAENTMRELSSGVPQAIGLSRLMDILRDHGNAEHAFLLRRESRFRGWRVEAVAGLVEIDRRADGIEQIERSASYFQSNLPRGGSLRNNTLSENIDQRDPDLTRLIHTFAVEEVMWLKPIGDQSKAWMKASAPDVAVMLTWSGLTSPPPRCLDQSLLIARLGLSAMQIPWWKAALYANKNFRPSLFERLSPNSWSGFFRWAAALLVVGAILCIPVPIRIDAPAILIPTVQQHVYSPADAIVDSILVEHGQKVVAGQPLIQLKSTALNADYELSIAQQLKNAQRITDIESSLLRERTLTAVQRDELEGELESLEGVQQIELAKMDRLKSLLQSMSIQAEFDGIITTWNLQDTLRDRPLRAGQWLFSLYQSNSTWVLEASMPERYADDFFRSMRDESAPLTASLTCLPQRKIRVKYLPDKIPRIETVAGSVPGQSQPEGILRVRFELDASELPEDMTLAGATARIDIPNGHGPIAWALTKDFVQKLIARVRMWL